MAATSEDQPVHDALLAAVMGLLAAAAIWLIIGGELFAHTGAWLAVLALVLASGAGLALNMGLDRGDP